MTPPTDKYNWKWLYTGLVLLLLLQILIYSYITSQFS
jgi:hypothetical protein